MYCRKEILLFRIKFKFSRVKVCLVVGYGPNEGIGEERERFWNDMDRIMDRVGNRYRLCMLGDLKGWIGDRVRVSIIGAFGVSRENEEWWSSVLKGGCLWVTHTSNTRICISTQGWQGAKMEWR